MTTTGHTWMSGKIPTFDVLPTCGLLRLPQFGTSRHPLPQDGLRLACEVLTGSFGAVSPPER